ncbi:membrane protein [Dictyobacter alpinus]|uniref:Membrane protein n=1 Tax=Dictyobacter alpinus TaxID=2014873 RepID=A0A402BJL4_9CHLR|nr:DMT family transporter [Dictyobacter alpinus]GCE31541.1 membrane protein [Dictyobacter alpinus]
MKVKDIGMLFLLAVMWGGSFLFMRIASPVLGPVVLIELRTMIAGLALLLYVKAIGRPLDLRARWRHYLIVGIINSALPFTLIATSELFLTAGLAAILNATTPLFGAIVAALWIKDRLTLKKMLGLLLGIIGVGILVGWSPLPLTSGVILGILAMMGASAFYGVGGVYTKVYMKGASPLAMTACCQLGAGLFLLPFTAAFPARHVPDLSVIISVAGLALVCTALAYLLYFRLIENVGPTNTMTVTFLVPFFSIFWGALFLHETVTLSTFIGFGIILLGTGFVVGLRLPRKIGSGRKQPALLHGEDALQSQEPSQSSKSESEVY